MFERFTEKAIKVIMLAQEEARRLGHNFVGTEQILLGLIGEGTGVAAKVLKSMGVNLKDARIEVEKIIGRGSGFVAVEIPFTPRAKRVLELSLEEARQLGHNYIGTEHLLLGLIREGEGVAARVLENLGVDLAKVRTQVIRMLGETAEVTAGGGGGGAKGSTKTPTLDEFGTNLTQMATESKLGPCGGSLQRNRPCDSNSWSPHQK
jgi:ATP-dependent Clp protease ATP-binding subunit ClpC